MNNIKTLLLLFILTFNFSVNYSQKKPNILFILADDLGWSDLSCYGNPIIQTPNIDMLAVQGMQFTNAYAAPVCAPTRAALQTGQYPARLQMTGIPNPHQRPWAKLTPPEVRWQLPLRYTSIAEALNEAGYTCGIFGKWHLGYEDTHQPEDQGYVYPEDKKLAPAYAEKVLNWAKENPHKGIGGQLLQSVRFIEENKDQPFFCFVSYNMVHTALTARDDLTHKYKKIVAKNRTTIHPIYAAMCQMVDESVGLLQLVLKELGLDENTVVVFYSDNGGVVEERGFLFHGYEELVTHNWPLRNEKGSLYEGGIRVPLIVHWPGVTKPGSVNHDLVHSVDFFPTFLDIAGGQSPDQVQDGITLVESFKGNGHGRNTLYFHYPHYHHSRPSSAIRHKNYKLIYFYENDTYALYNLQEDIGEMYNLANENPDIANELYSMLSQWLNQTNAGLPEPNPEFDYSKELLWGPRMSWDEIRESNKSYGIPE